MVGHSRAFCVRLDLIVWDVATTGDCFGEEAFESDPLKRNRRYGIQTVKGLTLLTIDHADCQKALKTFAETLAETREVRA